MQRSLTATVIQAQLRAIGIDVHIRTVEWAAFIREFVNKGRFDAIILGWTIPQDPDIYQVWHSSQAVEGGLNFTYYKNPEVDTLLEEARSIPGQSTRAPPVPFHAGSLGPESAILAFKTSKRRLSSA